MGDSLLSTKAVGEEPTVFKTKSLEVLLDRQRSSDMGGKKLGEGSSGVALPSGSSLFSNNQQSVPEAVDSQVWCTAVSYTGGCRPWAKRRGGFDLLALLVFLPSVIPSVFYQKIIGRGRPPGPSPRFGTELHNPWFLFWNSAWFVEGAQSGGLKTPKRSF